MERLGAAVKLNLGWGSCSEHFLVLLILHISAANGSVSRITLSGLAESLSVFQPRSAKTDTT